MRRVGMYPLAVRDDLQPTAATTRDSVDYPASYRGGVRASGPYPVGGLSSRGRYPGMLWAQVDHVDAVAGVAVWLVGEHDRGRSAGLVDDLRVS